MGWTNCTGTAHKINKQTGELKIQKIRLGCSGSYNSRLITHSDDWTKADDDVTIKIRKVQVLPKPEEQFQSGISSTLLWAFLIACAILTPILLFTLAVVCYLKRDKRNSRRKSFNKNDISGPEVLTVPDGLETIDTRRNESHKFIQNSQNQVEYANVNSNGQHENNTVDYDGNYGCENADLSGRNDESINVTYDMVNGKNHNNAGVHSGTDNNDDVPLLTPTLKDSAIGSSSQTAGLLQQNSGLLTVQDLKVQDVEIENFDDYPEKAKQIIQNSLQQQDRTSRLLQQVDNFVSDRESSSIAMGTSATSNPPSLVQKSENSPKNIHNMNDIFGSPDEDYIKRDVEESLMNVNTNTLKKFKQQPSQNTKTDNFKQPKLPNSLHVQPLSVSTNNTTNSRHSSNTTHSQHSRNLPSYEEAVMKKQKLKSEQQLRNLANYLQDADHGVSGINSSFVSSTLPRKLDTSFSNSLINNKNNNPNATTNSGIYSSYSTPYRASTLQRTTSANNHPNSPPTLKHANKIQLTSSPSQPLAPSRNKVEASNMDYC